MVAFGVRKSFLSRERSSIRVSSPYMHATRSCSFPRSNDVDQATQPHQNASRSGCFGGPCHSIPNRTVFVKSLSPDHGIEPLSPPVLHNEVLWREKDGRRQECKQVGLYHLHLTPFGPIKSNGSVECGPPVRDRSVVSTAEERDSSLVGWSTEFSPSPTITSRTLDKGYGFHRRLSLRDRATRFRSACRSSKVSRIAEKRRNGRWKQYTRNQRLCVHINAYIIIQQWLLQKAAFGYASGSVNRDRLHRG